MTMPASDRAATIESILSQTFAPSSLLVKDQSHLHAGHAGAEDGRGHFSVSIVSEQFSGQSRIQRQRAIYTALGSLMQTDIHALQIRALTPDESA